MAETHASLALAALELDADGRVSAATPLAAQLLDRTPRELIGERLTDVVTFSHFDGAFSVEAIGSETLVRIVRSGQTYFIRLVVGVTSTDGRLIILNCDAAHERSGRISRTGLSTALWANNAGAFTIDVSSRRLTLSGGLCRRLGLTQNDPHQLDALAGLIHSDDLEDFQINTSSEFLLGNTKLAITLRVMHKDANYEWLRFSGSVTRPEPSRPVLIGLVLNVSDEKRRTALQAARLERAELFVALSGRVFFETNGRSRITFVSANHETAFPGARGKRLLGAHLAIHDGGEIAKPDLAHGDRPIGRMPATLTLGAHIMEIEVEATRAFSETGRPAGYKGAFILPLTTTKEPTKAL